MSLRKFFLIVLAAIFCVTAVGNVFAGGSQEDAAGPKGKQVVRVLWQEIDPPSVSFIYNLENKFEEQTPGVNINLEFVSPNDVSSKVTSVVAGGGGLDVANLDGATTSRLAAAGKLIPINSVIEALWEDQFYQGTLLKVKDDYFGMPFVGESFSVWYRQDLFDKQGLSTPDIWDEWLSAAQKLTYDENGDGQKDLYGITLPASEHKSTGIWFEHFLALNGKNIFDRDLNVDLLDPRAYEALDFYTTLAKTAAPPQIGSWKFFEMIDAFTTGKVAMTMYTGRVLSRVYQGAPDLVGKVSTMPLPKKRMRAYHQGVSYNVVFDTSKYPDAAKQWVEFMGRPENAAPFFLTVPGHLVPVTKAQGDYLAKMDNEIIRDNPEIIKTLFDALDYALNDIVNGVAINEDTLQIEETGIFNPYFGVQRATDALPRAVQAVLYKGATPEAAMKKAQEEIAKAVAEAKRTFEKAQ